MFPSLKNYLLKQREIISLFWEKKKGVDEKCTSLYIFHLRVLLDGKTLEIWNHRRPEAVGEYASMHIFNLRVLLTAKLSKFGTTAILRRLGNVRPCTFLILEFCSPQNSRSLEPPPSVAVREYASLHIFNLRVADFPNYPPAGTLDPKGL